MGLDVPVFIAGGIGGPTVMFVVTPFRNGLTLGATNPTSGALVLYREVFSKGFARAWTGGSHTAVAAAPQFLCLGSVYHLIASQLGPVAGVLGASCAETAVLYGAESRNAQLAANLRAPGTIKSVQPSWKPWGPGVGVHCLRNLIAMAGLRLFCTPWTTAVEKATGKRNALTTTAGDLLGNICAACISAPVHQLYGFIVTTPEMSAMPASEARGRMLRFLKDQYVVTSPGGKPRLSATVPRDLFMRSMYVATAYTMYSVMERSLITGWPMLVGA